MDLQSLKIERSPAPAVRRRNPWPLRLCLLSGAAAAVWLAWPSLRTTLDRVRLPEVQVALVTETRGQAAAAIRGTAANGYVVAARRAALSSDVPGRIVELNVREGSVVRKGDVVARLYADEFRAALQRAEADLVTAAANQSRAAAAAAAAEAEVAQVQAAVATATAQCTEAAAQARFATLELARATDLLAQNIGSVRDRDRAQSDCEAASARHAALTAALLQSERAVASAKARAAVSAADAAVTTAQLRAATAARDLAKATLDKTDVRAPFDGVVVLKDAEVGEVVSPNVQGGSNARGAVCTLVDFASLEVQANVPETALAAVRLGAPADVFLDAFPNERYPGRVDRIWPTADRQKATVEVRVALERKDERLRPEMGVRIVFRAASAEAPEADVGAPTLLVDQTALVERQGQRGVFVLAGDTVQFTVVVPGESKAGRIAIESGLTAGARIVLAPPSTLQSGARVRQSNP
ncbi:MAG: efflux RND transporter periplasmic adaptor subunit [Planctomycetes bacterium]|nr:efflux RND transporter periplasmic adaptor subunit [Planctomycetota bacterium]